VPYNAIANVGQNAGAGINAFAQNRYAIQQDQLARENQLDQQRRNAFVQDRQYGLQREVFDAQQAGITDARKREHFERAVELAAAGAQDDQIVSFLSQMDPQVEPQALQVIRQLAQARAPGPSFKTVRPGETLFNEQSGQVAYTAPRAPSNRLVQVVDDKGQAYWVPEDQAAGMSASVPKPAPTPAQRAVDTAFAKDYNEFVVQGGFADVEKQLQQLGGVLEYLEGASAATGPFVGMIPKAMRDQMPGLREGADAQEMVEEVVQRNLRLILGAQFTEREGERLIARAYNPRQPESVNVRRVRNLTRQIQDAAQSKMEAAKYYEENGSLVGFRGKTSFSVTDFDPTDDGPISQGSIDRSGATKIGGATVVWE